MNTVVVNTVQDGTWQPTQLSVEQARSGLVKGTATLATTHEAPPIDLIDVLETRCDNIEGLGPNTQSDKVVKQISQGVVVAGLRQLAVEGNELHWMNSERELLETVQMTLSHCSEHPRNLFTQFQAVLTEHLNWVSHIWHTEKPLSVERQREKGLVPVSTWGRPISGLETEFKEVGPEWRLFYDRYLSVEVRLKAAIDQAISDGSIIRVEETERGDRLLPSTLGRSRETGATKSVLRFVLSRDLPAKWFSSVADLPQRRTNAIGWINRAGRQLENQGKRASKEDLLRIAGEKVDLSPHALTELWSKVDFPTKGKRGAIPTKERVSLDEIRALE